MTNSEIAKEALDAFDDYHLKMSIDDFSKKLIKPVAKKLSKKIIKQRLIDKQQKQDYFQVIP